MRTVVVGLGVQGRKRAQIAGRDLVATVDPVVAGADYRALAEVPVSAYDSVLLCIPDEPKPELIEHALKHGKHVLVEKPLLADPATLQRLADLTERPKAVCYTAYNHRFEPHIVRMKRDIDEGRLGRVYAARFYYGNGTARDVRNSAWRDRGAGVIPDLGSHLLDMALFLFDCRAAQVELWSARIYENRAYDHAVFGAASEPGLEMTVSLLSWRNHFTADIYGERGSAHIASLCKWGPSSYTLRGRVLPSGRPDEETVTLVQADPTWALEYAHFRGLCAAGGPSNLANDLWIQANLARLGVAA